MGSFTLLLLNRSTFAEVVSILPSFAEATKAPTRMEHLPRGEGYHRSCPPSGAAPRVFSKPKRFTNTVHTCAEVGLALRNNNIRAQSPEEAAPTVCEPEALVGTWYIEQHGSSLVLLE